jgi:hypothetical protein
VKKEKKNRASGKGKVWRAVERKGKACRKGGDLSALNPSSIAGKGKKEVGVGSFDLCLLEQRFNIRDSTQGSTQDLSQDSITLVRAVATETKAGPRENEIQIPIYI